MFNLIEIKIKCLPMCFDEEDGGYAIHRLLKQLFEGYAPNPFLAVSDQIVVAHSQHDERTLRSAL